MSQLDGPIGYGTMTMNGEKFDYVGSVPELPEGDKGDVAIMPVGLLEEIIKNEVLLLLTKKGPMHKSFFGKMGVFPDEIIYHAKGQEYKLFLDRNIYTQNPKDMMFFRYVSVDQSFVEEGPELNPGGNENG